MKLETLYKRDKKGTKVLVYECEVKDTNTNLMAYQIVKHSGELGGKMKLHEETITSGKQKRSIYEQAVFEAQSAWRKKKDEGYKTLADLNIHSTGRGYELMEGSTIKYGCASLNEILLEALPTERTDASGTLKPMKCTATNDTKTGKLIDKVMKKIIYPCSAQPKLDGVRGFVTHVHSNKWKATSSSGKSYDVMAREILREITELDIDEKWILDGEFYIHGVPLQVLSGWARKQTPIEEHLKMEFHIFDIPNGGTWEERRILLGLLSEGINPNGRLKIVDTTTIRSQDSLLNEHDFFVEHGYEGLIARNYKGVYEYGCRSNDIFKMKDFQDAEFTIVGATLGQRGTFDMVFNLVTKDGKEFSAKPLGDAATKDKYWADLPKLIGKEATVRYLTMSNEGKPQGNPVLKAIRDYE